ncbi:hypothetical protein [Thermococcus kodakarensis]|nr:hypothetical protein [Thermococcus kodakarensis]WCN27246.1 hypothetical protein POG15_06305 [Thermococcus kodakarensis]WCN29532.1 hypothetical protein POG21_06300 [Thermococcus kodakarensis]
MFTDITSLSDVFGKIRAQIDENSDEILQKLLQITPEEATKESYERAIGDINNIILSETSPFLDELMEAAENSYINPEEVKEEVLNILIPEIVELQAQVNESNRKLWEKALSKDNLTEEEVKQFEILDKFLSLEANLLGIMVENRDFNTIEELIGYFLLLLLRVLKIVEEERDLAELEKDFKIVAEKIKSLNPEPRTIDDYFIDELLED